jgi:hypothetical protein
MGAPAAALMCLQTQFVVILGHGAFGKGRAAASSVRACGRGCSGGVEAPGGGHAHAISGFSPI